MNKKKKLKILSLFIILISIILLMLSALNTFLIIKYDVLPFKYLIIFLVVVIIIPILLVLSNFKRKNKRKKKLKVFTIAVEIIYIVALTLALFYLSKTFSFLDSFANRLGYDIKNYYVVTLESRELYKIEDVKDGTMGFVKEVDNFNKALDMLEKKVKPEYKEYNNHDELFKDLYDKKIDTILVIDSYYDLFQENETEENKTKIIYTFSIKEKTTVSFNNRSVKVIEDPFNIYISGTDSYGKVSDSSRSDVNIIASINPTTNEILLINVPRDYFVTLPSYNAKDKLTHAGIYGVKESIGALEKLLDLKIDYYFKVNYNALVGLIDAIDGVDVYSEYKFTSGEKFYKFQKGYNHVNGDQALEFVRTRYAFVDGDRVRGENQQRMIKAIIDKIAGSTVLLRKYGTILNNLEGSFLTNISTNEITDLVKYQLDKMPSWNISSISLNGSDGSEYVYSYKPSPLYVMIPNEDTINNAKEILKRLNNGEKIVIDNEKE